MQPERPALGERQFRPRCQSGKTSGSCSGVQRKPDRAHAANRAIRWIVRSHYPWPARRCRARCRAPCHDRLVLAIGVHPGKTSAVLG